MFEHAYQIVLKMLLHDLIKSEKIDLKLAWLIYFCDPPLALHKDVHVLRIKIAVEVREDILQVILPLYYFLIEFLEIDSATLFPLLL